MRPWLVGESNPHDEDQRFALYPWPVGSAGGRLCRLVLGLGPEEYLRRFERRNLLPRGAWSAPLARESARAILAEAGGATLILLGRRVAAAFGLDYLPFTFFCGDVSDKLVLPHPSGRCRAWNDPSSLGRARSAVASVTAP